MIVNAAQTAEISNHTDGTEISPISPENGVIINKVIGIKKPTSRDHLAIAYPAKDITVMKTLIIKPKLFFSFSKYKTQHPI